MKVATVSYERAMQIDPATLHRGQAIAVQFSATRLAVISPIPSRFGPDILCGELRSEDGWHWAKSIRVAPATRQGFELILDSLQALAAGRPLRSVRRAS